MLFRKAKWFRVKATGIKRNKAYTYITFFCPKCDKSTLIATRFCPHCGKKLRGIENE